MSADQRITIDPRAGVSGTRRMALDTRHDPISVRAQAAMGSLEARQASYGALSDALSAGLASTQPPSNPTTAEVLALVESLREQVAVLSEAEIGRLLDVVDAVNGLLADTKPRHGLAGSGGSVGSANTAGSDAAVLVLARLVGASVGTDANGVPKVSVDGVILRAGAWSDPLWVRREASGAVRLVTSSGRAVPVTSGAAAGHVEMINSVLPSLVGGLDGTRSVLRHLGDDVPEPAALLRGVLGALNARNDAGEQVKPFLSAQRADQGGVGRSLVLDAGALAPPRPVSREQERLGTVHAASVGLAVAAIALGDATYQDPGAALFSTATFAPDAPLAGPAGFSFGVTAGGVDMRRTAVVTMSARSTIIDVADAINRAGTGVRAAIVVTDEGSVRLSMRSLTTARSTDLLITDGGVPACTSTHLGRFAVDGTSESAVRLRGAEVCSAVRSIVYACGVLVDTSAASASTKPLLGDRDLTSLAAGLVRTVRSADATAIPGLSVSGGRASFDETAFAAGYALDPGGTEARASALATRLRDLAASASAPGTGFLTRRLRDEPRD